MFATEAIGTAIQSAGYQVMFNTFGAHPAACAAAAEVLSILVEEDLVTRAAEQGAYLRAQLDEVFAAHEHVAEVRSSGLLAAIEVVQNKESLERFPLDAGVTSRIVGKGLQKGVFFYGGGTADVRDIVCMGPPFIISNSEIDQIVETLSTCVDEVVSETLGA